MVSQPRIPQLEYILLILIQNFVNTAYICTVPHEERGSTLAPP